MKKIEQHLIKISFETAIERTNLVVEFYKTLFDNNPDLAHLFPKDMSTLQRKMVEALSTVIEAADKPDVLASILIPMGRRHGKWNVNPEMLPAVTNTLLEVIASANGDQWSEANTRAWVKFLDYIGGLFLAGLSQSKSTSDSTPEILVHSQLAAAEFLQYDQKITDDIVEAIYRAGFDARVKLAEMAVKETGMGNVESKVMKNVLATQLVWEDIKDLKTVGTIGVKDGMIEVAKPMGVVLAVIPVTNPTSTTLYKILTALKSRNSIIITGASRAKNCTNETARIAYEAAIKAGAPLNCIQWVENPNRDFTQKLMSQPDVAIILATGGEGLVTSAYSSGTPAFGVGAGNVPVYVHENTDFNYVAKQVISSKTFDNGTICASEQAIICTEDTYDELIKAFENYGGYLLNEKEVSLLEKVAINEKGTMNAVIVGKTALNVAEVAGINVPSNVKLLIAPQTKVGIEAPLSQEILAPIIAIYKAANHFSAISTCVDINHYGGAGHTAAIYSDDQDVIEQYGNMMNAGRILVNVPTSGGAVGMCTSMTPSLTLGCGTSGGNITTNNLSARDLLNIQRIAMPVNSLAVSKIDISKYMDSNFTSTDAEKELIKTRLL